MLTQGNMTCITQKVQFIMMFQILKNVESIEKIENGVLLLFHAN
jgi:hypothetical protein